MSEAGTHLIVDRALLRKRLARANQTDVHPLVTRIADDVIDRLSLVLRTFETAVVISPVVSGLPARLLQETAVKTVIDARLAPVGSEGSAPLTAVIDDEMLPLKPGSIDLIVSVLALQATNDLPGALVQARRALRPDGLFVGVLAGGRSLHELRHALINAEAECEEGASPRVLPFGDVRDLGGLMQRSGFALPVADVDTISLTYPTALHVMHELRRFGATNTLPGRSRKMMRRATLMRAAEIYSESHRTPDGRVKATVELVTLTGWAPDPGQQKPLRPGSATSRLAEALGTQEHALLAQTPDAPEVD